MNSKKYNERSETELFSLWGNVRRTKGLSI